MAIQSINSTEAYNHPIMNGFNSRFKGISYGYMNLNKKPEYYPKATFKDKFLAGVGAVGGVSLATWGLMKHQKVKNPLKLEYDAKSMLLTAGLGNKIGRAHV